MTPTKEAELRLAAANAESKLRSLARIFNGQNFTDRYGDGAHCEKLADNLHEALK